jgi:hypothetical protein
MRNVGYLRRLPLSPRCVLTLMGSTFVRHMAGKHIMGSSVRPLISTSSGMKDLRIRKIIGQAQEPLEHELREDLPYG